MKTSVRYKLLPIIIAGIVVLSAVFYGLSLQVQHATLSKNALDGIHSAKETFYNLEKNDIRTLKAAIIQFNSNQDFVSRFLENDRQRLYEYGQGLFSKNKELGITHFYFHRTDGTVFVRLHNASKHDDRVTRKTFNKSKRTRDWGSGIELGKTAFALRVVHPYYNNNQLIGYVEFGEEIDHFIDVMKEQTGHDYAIVVEKQYINPEKWASVRESKGITNNYGELDNHVIIDTTMEDTSLFEKYCFTQQNLEAVSDDGEIFRTFNVAGKAYVAGGFSLYDAGNEKVGAVVTIEDISAVEDAQKEASLTMLIITIIGASLISAIIVVAVRNVVTKPLDGVVRATTRIAGGDFGAQISVKSNDEIGALAELVERFKQMLINTAKELDQAQKKQR